MVEGVVVCRTAGGSDRRGEHRAIPTDIWRLGAAHSVMTLTGSALLALALAHDAVSPDEAWNAAHVDEDWQMEQWGRDTLGDAAPRASAGGNESRRAPRS